MNTDILHRHILTLHICSTLVQKAPDTVFLAQAHEQSIFSAWPVDTCTQEGAVALAALQALFSVGPGDEDALYQEHLALFSGQTPAAKPWESVWREKDKLLFGEQTMRVRESYAQWGLVSEAEGREPEDFLGLELVFCVCLLDKMAAHVEGADKALKTFLDDHLLAWAEPCLRTASAMAKHDFYRHMPLLCLDALQSLHKTLSVEPSAE